MYLQNVFHNQEFFFNEEWEKYFYSVADSYKWKKCYVSRLITGEKRILELKEFYLFGEKGFVWCDFPKTLDYHKSIWIPYDNRPISFEISPLIAPKECKLTIQSGHELVGKEGFEINQLEEIYKFLIEYVN